MSEGQYVILYSIVQYYTVLYSTTHNYTALNSTVCSTAYCSTVCSTAYCSTVCSTQNTDWRESLFSLFSEPSVLRIARLDYQTSFTTRESSTN